MVDLVGDAGDGGNLRLNDLLHCLPREAGQLGQEKERKKRRGERERGRVRKEGEEGRNAGRGENEGE